MSADDSVSLAEDLDALRDDLTILYALADYLAFDGSSSYQNARFVQVDERVNHRLEHLAGVMAAQDVNPL